MRANSLKKVLVISIVGLLNVNVGASFAANPSATDTAKVITNTANAIYTSAASMAKSSGEKSPSESDLQLAFGGVNIPSGIVLDPSTHAVKDSYGYNLTTYICSTGVSKSPCPGLSAPTTLLTPGSKNNTPSSSGNTTTGNSNGKGSPSTLKNTTPSTGNNSATNNSSSSNTTSPNSTTPNNSTNVSTSSNANPTTANSNSGSNNSNINNTQSIAPKVVPLPKYFKTFTVKESSGNLILTWSYLKKAPAKLILTEKFNNNLNKMTLLGTVVSKTIQLKAAGSYDFTITSPSSSDSKTVTIKAKLPPLPGKNLTVNPVGSKLYINWERNFDSLTTSSSPALENTLEINYLSGVSTLIKLPVTKTYYTLETVSTDSLKSLDQYYSNEGGDSAKISYTPNHTYSKLLTAVQTSPNSLTLKWSIPSTSATESLLITSPGSLRDKEILSLNASDTTTTLSGLTPLATYNFTLTQTHGDSSVDTLTLASVKLAGIPSTPLSLVVTPQNNALAINWINPTYASDGISNYLVQYKLSSANTWTPISLPAGDYSTTPYLLTGLTNGYQYIVKVNAINSIATSLDSTIVYGTPVNVPQNPTNLVAVGGSNYADLEWTTPTLDNTQSVYGYLINYRVSGSSYWIPLQVTGTGNTYRVNNLTTSLGYDFEVAALTNFGTTSFSNIATTNTAQNNYAITAYTPTMSNGTATLTWYAPAYLLANTGIQGYLVEYQSSGSNNWTPLYIGTPNTEIATISNLNSNITYNFRVSAILPVGSSILSTLSNTVSGISYTYTPPTNVTNFTSSISGTSAVLTWSPVSNSSTVTYTLAYQIANGQWVTAGSTTTNTYTVTNLTLGQNYTFSIVASNVAGSSIPVYISNNTFSTPTAVQNLSASNQGASLNTVNLTWNDPLSNGGSYITGYMVEYQAQGDNTWTTFTASTNLNHITVTGLLSGVTYNFRVTPINSAGNGLSSIASAMSIGLPTAVQNLTATVSGTSVTLNWNPPLINGGIQNSAYTVEFKLSTEQTWTWEGVYIPNSATSYTVTGLTPGLSYNFLVYEETFFGNGNSATVNATIPNAG